MEPTNNKSMQYIILIKKSIKIYVCGSKLHQFKRFSQKTSKHIQKYLILCNL